MQDSSFSANNGNLSYLGVSVPPLRDSLCSGPAWASGLWFCSYRLTRLTPPSLCHVHTRGQRQLTDAPLGQEWVSGWGDTRMVEGWRVKDGESENEA